MLSNSRSCVITLYVYILHWFNSVLTSRQLRCRLFRLRSIMWQARRRFLVLTVWNYAPPCIMLFISIEIFLYLLCRFRLCVWNDCGVYCSYLFWILHSIDNAGIFILCRYPRCQNMIAYSQVSNKVDIFVISILHVYWICDPCYCYVSALLRWFWFLMMLMVTVNASTAPTCMS